MISWITLLPLAMTTISIAAKPNGGWKKYLGKTNNKKEKKVSNSAFPRLSRRDSKFYPRSRSLDPEHSRRLRHRSPLFYGHTNVDISSRRANVQDTHRCRSSRQTLGGSPVPIRVYHTSFGERRGPQNVPEELRRTESLRSNTMAEHTKQRQRREENPHPDRRRRRTSREPYSSLAVD